MVFESDSGEAFWIDDLIGKEVEIEGVGVFIVPND